MLTVIESIALAFLQTFYGVCFDVDEQKLFRSYCRILLMNLTLSYRSVGSNIHYYYLDPAAAAAVD